MRNISQYPNLSYIELQPYSIISKIYYAIYALFTRIFREELLLLYRSRRLSPATVQHLLSMLTLTYQYVFAVKAKLRENIPDDSDRELYFYSYWMAEHALAACLLKKTFAGTKAVSRCHGYDLYEYRDPQNYIPFRRYLLRNLDAIYSISNDGKQYLETKYGPRENIRVARLGTKDYGYNTGFKRSNTLRIVSCSWAVPVKRIHRIIDALSQIDDISVIWHHIGGGSLLDGLRRYAKEKLAAKENIFCSFEGDMSNAQLMTYYKEHAIDALINVSESEGIPVSIMEAISFGIIPIATQVGGVSEIIEDSKTGYLLDKDYRDQDLIDHLRRIFTMPDEDLQNFRMRVRKFWQENYNEAVNNKSFASSLIECI